jgi:hypothetical protein
MKNIFETIKARLQPAPEQPAPEQPEQAVSEHPEYPMPEGWEDAMWQGMAPEVRGKVDAVMKDHAKALGDKALEVQTMQTQHREVMEKANAELCEMARSDTISALNKVLLEASERMRNGYNRADN